MIKQEEEGYKLDDDTMVTLLFKIMPKEYVKDLRDKLNKVRVQDYHGFEQAPFDEIQ